MKNALAKILILSAMLVSASVAIAEDQDIVVEGRKFTEATMNKAVQAVGRPQALGGFDAQYARWTVPVCVGVAARSAETGQAIADRIGAVARDIGIGADKPGCAPNIVILVVKHPTDYLKKAIEHSPNLFGNADHAALKHMVDSEDPVRWAGSTTLTSAQGDQIIPDGFAMAGHSAPAIPLWNASHVRASTRTMLTHMTIVVDADQVDQVPVARLANYLAMVSLAQIDIHQQRPPVPTILSLFPAGGDAPDDLTTFDRAYLKALYSIDPALAGSAQRAALARAVYLILGRQRP